jgi:SAM-dependent methyltransferase
MAAMYEHSAHIVYDLLNSARGKDYVGEASAVASAVRARCAEAATLLDVGCGTGRHIEAFAADGFDCVGVDVSRAMLSQASVRCPETNFIEADIRTMDVGRTFDAVVCLNGTIGYMLTAEDLRAAVSRLRAHLADDGVVVVEPWFAPNQWFVPNVSAESAKEGDVAVARVSRATAEGSHGVFEWTCAVATHEESYSFSELHRLALREIPEYIDAAAEAGLTAIHEPLPGGRGLGIIIATLTSL